MSTPDPNGILRYRLERLEERVRKLEAADITVVADRVRVLADDQRDFRERQEREIREFRAQVRGEMASQEKVVREEMAGMRTSMKEVRDELVGNRRAQYVGLFGLVGVFVGVALTFAYG